MKFRVAKCPNVHTYSFAHTHNMCGASVYKEETWYRLARFSPNHQALRAQAACPTSVQLLGWDSP